MEHTNLFVQITLIVICHLARYTMADAPNFISGCGLTVHNISNVNPQLYDIYVTTEQVPGPQEIRILVPLDYTTSGPNRRYPVLYLLHGGDGTAKDWTSSVNGKAQEILGNLSLIVVSPNADRYGWYTNWITPGKHGPQNWRTFHNEQVIPWIDLNLRTVAKKGGRAIAGLSMGGLGAIRYPEVYPELYTYAASFSGALDLEDLAIQLIVYSSNEIIEHNGAGAFGPPFVFNNESGFVQQNPVRHAESLRGIDVAIYTGNVGTLEEIIHTCSINMHKMLTSLNISHYFLDYGNGSGIGQNCTGKHEWACWNAALRDVAPRMMAVLQQQQE